jgi:hypothetical protein
VGASGVPFVALVIFLLGREFSTGFSRTRARAYLYIYKKTFKKIE